MQIVMPRLSDSMEEGTILTWLVKEGEEIERGQPIAEIETDKATMTYESDRSGTLTRILVQEGETAALGEPIAEIDGETGDQEPEKPTIAEAPAPAAAPTDTPDRGEWTPSTPLAREKARQQGLEIKDIAGSGPGGRVVAADIPEGQAATPELSDSRETTRIERLIAKRMVEGKQAPEFWAEREIDLTRINELREELKASGEKAPSINSLIMLAVARAAQKNPRLNSSYQDEEIVFYPSVNLGMAVATEETLIVPVIREAEEKSLQELDQEAKRLSEAARGGAIDAKEMEGSTITVSSLGSMGVDRFQAILPPGNSAIVALGAMREKLELRSGQIEERQVISITVTVDHRSVYGAHLAAFLSDLSGLLENPLRLI